MGMVYKLKYKSVIAAAITLFIMGHMHDEMIIERDKWVSFERHKTIEHTSVLRYIKKAEVRYGIVKRIGNDALLYSQ